DDDPLNYSLTTAPPGMTINATTGEIAWNPGDTAGGGGLAFALGSTGDDRGGGTRLHKAGNLYGPGLFEKTGDFDPGPGIVNLTSVGSSDVFVAKFDSTGQLIWVRRVGGDSYDEADDIALDDQGNVYIAGVVSGTVDFDPGPGIFQYTSNGGQDGFA